MVRSREVVTIQNALVLDFFLVFDEGLVQINVSYVRRAVSANRQVVGELQWRNQAKSPERHCTVFGSLARKK